MAYTYTHRIVSLKKSNGVYLNTINSFVVEVTASNGSNSVSHSYAFRLPKPIDDGINNSFIDYSDITEAQLISWATGDVVQYDVIKEDINKRLEENLQDDVESNFPWV